MCTSAANPQQQMRAKDRPTSVPNTLSRNFPPKSHNFPRCNFGGKTNDNINRRL